MFLNEYEIDEARHRYFHHPLLGPATETLANLRDAVNAHSDGWAYWNPPLRAAAKLMQLVEGSPESRFDRYRPDVTPARLKAAYSPLKAFRTRMKSPPSKYGSGVKGFDFNIVEVSA